MSVISVYAVFSSRTEAEEIGRAMIDEGLAACVNILGEVHSLYRWNGKIESSEEIAAIFKTSETSIDALITGIAALHSYEIPCVATWRIDKILGSYADWVERNVGSVTRSR